MRILIVDSDPAFRRDASVAFDESQVEHLCLDGWAPAHEELTRRGNGKFDAMVVEIGRPSMKGFDFLRLIRADGVLVPVIFSARRESSEDRVKGLELGADDYIVKPFEWRDLFARLRAVIRRQLRATKVRIGEFEIDLAVRHVEIAGKPLRLSAREFDLFWVLLEAGGRSVSHAELRKRLWSDGPNRGSNEKLGRTGVANIESVRGEGYRLQF